MKKVVLDRKKCNGHARCVAAAPELFDTDELGYAVLLRAEAIDAEQEEAAAAAVLNCPEFAITVLSE